LEPLFLADAINRAGGRAVLVFRDYAPPPSGPIENVVIRFRASGVWDIAAADDATDPAGSTVLVPSGIRNCDFIRKAYAPRIVRAAFSAVEAKHCHASILVAGATPTDLEITFRPIRSLKGKLAAGHAFAFQPSGDLGQLLADALMRPTAAAGEAAARLVERAELREAHVCDHMFFESALIAHAVADRGGKVVVWPHSTNAVHVAARPASLVDEVVAMTSSAAAIWRKRFPAVPVKVSSGLMLRHPAGPRPLTPGGAITVVLFASAHRLNRMSILDIPVHADTYRRIFSGIARLGPGVRLLCKAKEGFESMQWLQQLAGPIALEAVTDTALAIDLPNLIYISVSFGSSALLEGLGRGIPCMVVREGCVEDYTGIEAPVPIGDVEFILRTLCKCQDPVELDEMTRQQMAWYRMETDFTGTSP
jgi:hypothetical protein